MRHSRVTRIPARALWERDGDISASVAAVARLAQLPDHELSSVPPDPLVVAALFESCDEDLERSIAGQLEQAVRAIDGGRCVRGASGASQDLADELASHEAVVLAIDSCGQAGLKDVSLADVTSAPLKTPKSNVIKRD